MDEDRIRQLVRDALGKHLGERGLTLPEPNGMPPHISHRRFLTLAQGDGSCIVEPAVRCTHCGFCQTYGH